MQAPTQPVTVPLLVLGWGNLSRGDDALGPLCVASLRQQLSPALRPRVEFLEDYQLQIEHALDLVGRVQVLFVDASRVCASPFEVRSVQAQRDPSLSSHALSAQALLQVFCDFHGPACTPPPATLLAIRGDSFELGQPLGAPAQANLAAAVAWGLDWIGNLGLPATQGDFWQIKPLS